MKDYLPDLRNLSNEVVFVLTLIASIIGEIVAVLNGMDWESGILAILPVASGLVARLGVYGPQISALLAEPADEVALELMP